MTDSVQLLGISNAIVDVLAEVEYPFLDQIGAPPGSMILIDEDQARDLYAQIDPVAQMSGGSVANTVAGFANLGGTAAYIGKVRNDDLGDVFNDDMRSLGVDIRLDQATGGAPTARSHVLITDDGQRTMQTYLGACTELSLQDITAETIGSPKVVLLEGFVWDIADGPALAIKAAEIAKETGASVALSLSDSFCVERHREAFESYVRDHADIVVANEDELLALLQINSFDAVAASIESYENLFAITRSGKGSVIVHGDLIIEQAATRVQKVTDSTGAGDAYCAGFLFGWAKGEPLAICAQYGTYCATKVIQQIGGRIEKGLLDGFA